MSVYILLAMTISNYHLRRLGIDMVTKDCEKCGKTMQAKHANQFIKQNRGY